MQKESEDIPKRIRRIHNAGTPEVAGRNLSDTLSSTFRTGTIRNRMTMMPGDITQAQKLPERKITVNRQSIMPSQLSLDVQKKQDTECKELELGLLYDEYLQTIMMDFIIKKKTEQKKQFMVTQLATVAHEIEQDMKKLIKIKTREHDIMSLSSIQKEVDMQLAAATKCTKHETFKTAKDILIKLQSLLEPLDVLQCNDIILPETQDEWEKTQEVLIRSSDILKSIGKLIESKSEMYCAVNAELKGFIETHNEIENIQKKLEEALCNLQILILKNSSFSLTHD